MKIVVDAMGGDYAPKVVIDGVLDALKEYDLEVILVGQEDKIQELLSNRKYDKKRLHIQHASEIVDMCDSPAVTIRKKKDSSISIGLKLVKDGKADAFFSAGNTGAVVCAATLTCGLLPGVERPGIATLMPTLKGVALVIDVGANIASKPLHLLQYGIMANVYSKAILKKANPKVGLLNVGEEESKGTDFIKESYDFLSKSNLNFIGNVEGKHIFSGDCDIIICDGFVGNVVLKVSEGLAEALLTKLKKYLMGNPLGALGLMHLKGSFKKFKKDIDYSEYGGAPLLGVNGVVIIGHGRSNAYAIKNAVRLAKEEIEGKFNEHILEDLSKMNLNK